MGIISAGLREVFIGNGEISDSGVIPTSDVTGGNNSPYLGGLAGNNILAISPIASLPALSQAESIHPTPADL